LSNHDAFRRGGLGKSGLQIWEALQEGPKSITELIERTGKCRRTIKRKIERMQNIIDMRTGEIISLLEFDGERYSPMKNIDPASAWRGTPLWFVAKITIEFS